MILISNIVLEVLDGSTIASTEIYGADKKTYVNIGSGNVFNLKWNTPALTNDTVDRYDLVIKRYDPTLSVYYDIFDKNIGLVNEFYVNADMLPVAPEQYLLHIYVVARGKTGGVVTSNVVTPYVSKGSGTYIKTGAGYMKRALSFVNAPSVSKEVATLLDVTGKELQALDENGNPTTIGVKVADNKVVVTLKDVIGRDLQILDAEGNPVPFEAEATRLLYSDSWNIVQESHIKGTDGSWHKNDIMYEILLDAAGGIITDVNNDSIYVL